MAGPLIAPPDLAPSLPRDVTPEECLVRWVDLMNTCEQFLLAGLRRRLAPGESLEEAYRLWYVRTMEERDRQTLLVMEELARRSASPDG
jgi:hypothetical protein